MRSNREIRHEEEAVTIARWRVTFYRRMRLLLQNEEERLHKGLGKCLLLMLLNYILFIWLEEMYHMCLNYEEEKLE